MKGLQKYWTNTEGGARSRWVTMQRVMRFIYQPQPVTTPTSTSLQHFSTSLPLSLQHCVSQLFALPLGKRSVTRILKGFRQKYSMCSVQPHNVKIVADTHFLWHILQLLISSDVSCDMEWNLTRINGTECLAYRQWIKSGKSGQSGAQWGSGKRGDCKSGAGHTSMLYCVSFVLHFSTVFPLYCVSPLCIPLYCISPPCFQLLCFSTVHSLYCISAQAFCSCLKD